MPTSAAACNDGVIADPTPNEAVLPISFSNHAKKEVIPKQCVSIQGKSISSLFA